MSKSKSIFFKITINKWNDHNNGAKKFYKYTKIRNDFCSDSKLRELPLSHRWLYLSVLLTCGEQASDTVEMSERQLREALESSKSVERALLSLQSFQLLTYEIKEVKINLPPPWEEKGREEKGRIEREEVETFPLEKLKKQKIEEKTKTDLNFKIWNSYKEAYFTRYKVDPHQNAKVNSLISQLGKRLGPDAIEVVKFYLMHNKTFYLSKMHDLVFCVSDAEALKTQWLRGRAITERDVSDFSKNASMSQLVEDVSKGGL